MITVTIPAGSLTLTGQGLLAVARTAYHPAIGDVAAVLRARTYDSNGVEVGTFNSQTRPTAQQVQEIIEGSISEVRVQAGDEIPDRLVATARQAVVLRTAASIERSYYPEQAADRDNNAYQLFLDDYKSLMTILTETIVNPSVGVRAMVSVSGTPVNTGVLPWYEYSDLLP